ncbi:MAG: hypothetical protein WBB67_07620 [bacterium]
MLNLILIDYTAVSMLRRRLHQRIAEDDIVREKYEQASRVIKRYCEE